MIARWLAQKAEEKPEAVFLSFRSGQVTYGKFLELVRERSQRIPDTTEAVGLVADATLPTYTDLFAVDHLGVPRVYLIGFGGESATCHRLKKELNFSLLHEISNSSDGISRGTPHRLSMVHLFTSGTTGTPKPVPLTWPLIAKNVHISAQVEHSRWLLTFTPFSFAGLQVLLHALQNGGAMSVFGGGNLSDLVRLAMRDKVTHVSGTPSFFRSLLSGVTKNFIKDLPFKQITLGGEIVDQTILDSLSKHFPEAKITHIYASTELGVGFSVKDGRAGFPLAYLEAPEGITRLKIINDELFVQTPSVEDHPFLEDCIRVGEKIFCATGDKVEVMGDRVYFLGRKTDCINVGGNKVYPGEIENILLSIPGVRSTRVFKVKNSLTGNLVGADIVIEENASPEEMRTRLLSVCRLRLAPYKIPRVIQFVPSINVSSNNKIVREGLK